METLTIFNSLSKQLSSMEKHFTFCFPFVVLSSSLNILFVSSKFQDLQKTNKDVLTFITEKVSKIKPGIFRVSTIDITIKKIALLPNSEQLFIAYTDDVNNLTSSPFYQIAKYCHDIQEPLRNISNFLQLIKFQLPDNADEKTISYINYAIDNIKTLGQWNKNILCEGCYDLVSSFDLSKVIDEIKNLLKTQICKKNCKIILDKNIKPIFGNYFEILSLFKNLIENSLKHSKSEFLTITISLLNSANSNINIIFQDDGGILSKEDIIKIENALRNNVSKDNFGLTICKNILNNHSGTIKFIKTHDGCAYELNLPIKMEECCEL